MENLSNLTKKEIGRINSSLTQSKLQLFDLCEKMNTERSKELLCDIIKRYPQDTKKVLDTFICSSSTECLVKKIFTAIDSLGLKNVAILCNNLNSVPNILDKVVIRTVFGATENMPFRGLVYLLPALRLCEELIRNGSNNSGTPNIEFMFMNGAGILVNSMNQEKVNYATDEFIKIAEEYIREYHPLLSKNVYFCIDKNFSFDIINTQEYDRMVHVLEKLIKDSQLKNDLLKMGENKSTIEDSIRYAALHAFVQDGYVNSNIAHMYNFDDKKNNVEAEFIISIGAKPEEKFYQIRKLLANTMHNVSFFIPKNTVQYITSINVPPYSPLKTGELYMEEVIKNPTLIEKARIRDRKNQEYSEYQIPVQKAIELIIEDVEHSNSEKSLFEFIGSKS